MPLFIKTHPIPAGKILITAASALLILITASCGKKEDDQSEEAKAAPIVSELLSNQLGSLPLPLYQSEAFSAIRWQPWTKETFERARKANRLLFCVIGFPQHHGFKRDLEALAADPAVVDIINSNYVPVLVDADAIREVGILSADLCREIRTNFNMPMLLWISYDAKPVAWIPVDQGDSGAIVKRFNDSHSMVGQMWQEDPSYVMKNSAMNSDNRRERLQQRKLVDVMSPEPQADTLRSIRQLTSLYDPFSRSFDETGGLFPSGSIELLANSAKHLGLPAELRQQCLGLTGELLKDLLPSAMIDPLDGGLFASRRANSWAIPNFIRDCPTQGTGAVALLSAYRATGDRRALDSALGLISFAEKNYATPDGLFALGFDSKSNMEHWLWSVEDIRKNLDAADAEWWIKATGMKGLGNIPSESDPSREFFRSNTIGMQQTVAEIAKGLELSVEEFLPRYEATKQKLLAVRDERFGKKRRDQYPHAASTLRMVSAYAAAFSATGDDTYRKKAVTLLERFKEEFSDGARLRLVKQDTPASLAAARAFIYALAMQSALDVATITMDEKWVLWSEDLATISTELFTGDGLIKECPDDASLLDIPVTDIFMIYDDSTAGLMSISEARLTLLGRPLLAELSRHTVLLPTYAVTRPVVHTDLLTAALIRYFPVKVTCGKNLSPELAESVLRLPMRTFPRRAIATGEDVPDGAVRIVYGNDKEGVLVRTPQALQQALLPPDENS